jgi:hypothetical protein
MQPKKMTNDEIESTVAKAIQDAVDFVESEISEDRVKAQRYFDGETDLGYEDGRSSVVATKVRDIIRSIKPSLMRVFLNTDKPVEFVPKGSEDVGNAEQATSYVHWKFNELGGYKILNDAFHDALVKKTGIVKTYWEDYDEHETFTFTNLSDAEFALIVNEDDIEVIEHSETIEISMDPMGMEMQVTRHDIKIVKTFTKGKLCVESVPPEEFFVDRNARSIDDAYVVCHRAEMRVGDVVAMGFDFDQVSELSGISETDSLTDEEEQARRGYSRDRMDEDYNDPSMKNVLITEAYMRMDVDGTGYPILYKFILGGSGYELMDMMPCDNIPFAVFECDPEPHAFYGRSVADLIMNDQDASTSMLRGVLDNVALTNNPQLGVIEELTNMDDLLNNEIGAIVRMKQQGAVTPMSVPFVAGTTLPAMQYMDQQIEQKTGVTRASMGLDPDALQNTTATAVNATMQAAAGQVEVIARNFAEGGMKRLFKLMLEEFIKNTDDETVMRLNGRFTPIDPRVWNSDMDLSINVGLGTGQEDTKMAALNQALGMQMQIWSNYGPSNGLVTMTQIRNTLADMLAMGGLRNSDRYFMPMDPQTEQLLVEQAQQAQQAMAQGQDPTQAYLQAETIKMQGRLQSDQMKTQAKMQADMAKMQFDAQKAAAEEDLERDKMDQQLLVDAADIYGKYGTAVDVARIKNLQNTPRQ